MLHMNRLLLRVQFIVNQTRANGEKLDVLYVMEKIMTSLTGRFDIMLLQ